MILALSRQHIVLILSGPPRPVPRGACEEDPCKLIKDFQGELEVLCKVIKVRIKKLKVPYTYMSPALLEYSVGIWLSQSMKVLTSVMSQSTDT